MTEKLSNLGEGKNTHNFKIYEMTEKAYEKSEKKIALK